MDTVIIVADLLNAPSEKLAIHWLTTELKLREHLTVVIEAEDYAKDIYYHFLKRNGLCDGIAGIVTPEERVEGVRLDHNLNFPNTLKTDAIYSGNMERLFKLIHAMTDMQCLVQARYHRTICAVEHLKNVKLA